MLWHYAAFLIIVINKVVVVFDLNAFTYLLWQLWTWVIVLRITCNNNFTVKSIMFSIHIKTMLVSIKHYANTTDKFIYILFFFNMPLQFTHSICSGNSVTLHRRLKSIYTMIAMLLITVQQNDNWRNFPTTHPLFSHMYNCRTRTLMEPKDNLCVFTCLDIINAACGRRGRVKIF